MTTSKQKSRKLLKKRIIAFSIDLMVIGIFEKVALLTMKSAVSGMLLYASSHIQSGIGPAIRRFELPLLLACYVGYFFCCYLLSEGHTLGKSIMNLRVHRPHDHRGALTPREAMMRTWGYLFCYMSAGLLFMIPVLSRSQKGLPDWLSGTIVSDEEELIRIEAMEDHSAHNVQNMGQLLLFPEDPNARDESEVA